MKLSSYFLITVITVVLVALIISKANDINLPTSGKDNMALYVTAINEALLRQFIDKVADLTNRDAWRKPELFPEIEAMCAEWKPMAGMWKAHKISELTVKLCDLHEVRIAHQQLAEVTQ